MNPFRRFTAASKRVWWLFIICIAVGAALAAALGIREGTKYTASAQVLITAGDGGALATKNLTDPSLNVTDAQLVAQSANFYQSVGASLAVSSTDLQKILTVSNPVGSDALNFSVSVASSSTAIRYANTIDKAFVSYYSSFLVKAGTIPSGTKAAEIISSAIRATKVKMGLAKDIVIGGVAGLVIAIILVGLIESADRTIRLSQEADEALRVRTIYLPASRVRGRGEALERLSHQITLRNRGQHYTKVGVLALAASSDAARSVALSLAESLRSDGLRAVTPEVESSSESDRDESPTGIVFTVTNLVDASSVVRSTTDITIWIVVVLLGTSTERDLEHIRQLMAAAEVDQAQVIGVTLSTFR